MDSAPSIGFTLPLERNWVNPTLTENVVAFADSIAQACEQIHESGVAILPGQLLGQDLELARQLTYAGAEEDERLGRDPNGFALDYGDANVRVWNILNRGEVFADLVQRSVVIELITEFLGWPALLGNISANIAKPANEGGAWHQDQLSVPKPWPDKPQGLNCAWLLDDFTSDNGATEVVPGSHHLGEGEETKLLDGEVVPIIAPAGSHVIFESRVWQRTGVNRSASPRAALFAWYTTPIYRTQENWFLSLDRKVVESASDELLTLLAYKSQGLGLVYGQSPQ